jgi:hypothetical protein
LNGIGGRTIDEAKRTITFDEAVLWQSYIDKRGSLNTGRRVNISGAHIAAILSKANGGKLDFYDFAFFEREKESQKETAIKQFGAISVPREKLSEFRKKNRRRK